MVRICIGSRQVMCIMLPACIGRLEGRTLQMPPSHVPVQMQLSEQALPTSHVACVRAAGKRRKCGVRHGGGCIYHAAASISQLPSYY